MNVSWLQFTLAVVIFIGGVLIGVYQIGYIVASTLAKMKEEFTLMTATIKAEYNAKLEMLEATQNKKIDRTYERFDEFKKNLELTHVRKELCAEIRSNFSKEFSDIKADLKDIKGYLRDKQ